MATPKKKPEAKGKGRGRSAKGKYPARKPLPAHKAGSARRGGGTGKDKEEEARRNPLRRPARAGSSDPRAKAKPAPEVEVEEQEIPEEPETSTEELWALYRKEASKRGPKDPSCLEELRNLLIERHYPLVRYIAERLLQTLPKSIELDDLVSAGLFGLMDAIRGFDASRGIKFKTYCSTRIRGAILDQLRSQDWVPRLVRLKASRIERALQRLTAEYGREPTHAELARVLEMDHTDLVKEIQESRAKTMFSLSEKWEDDDGAVEKVEVLEDRTAIDPVHEMNRRDLMAFITRALTHKERFIIEQYYQYGHTMREIGEMLALTESRVCQIHSNVMSRLKGLLGQRSESLQA
jgi:RNA polymerase sigma factor for flagellar operon FliA